MEQVTGEGSAVFTVRVDAIGQLVFDLQPHLIALMERQRMTMAAGGLVRPFRGFGYRIVITEQANLKTSGGDSKVEGKDVGAVDRCSVDTLQGGKVALPICENTWEGDRLVLSRI